MGYPSDIQTQPIFVTRETEGSNPFVAFYLIKQTKEMVVMSAILDRLDI